MPVLHLSGCKNRQLIGASINRHPDKTRHDGALQATKLESRLELYIEGKVRAVLQSEAVQASLQQRLNDARRVMESEVEAALEAERRKAQEERAAKQAAIEAKQQELEKLQREREQEVWCFGAHAAVSFSTEIGRCRGRGNCRTMSN